MNLRKISLYILCLIVGFVSCKKDDDPTVEPIELRDRTEQQLVDMDSLNKYLDTHYYNSTEFESNPNPSISDLIIIKRLEGETVPDGYIKLKIAVGVPKSIVFADTDYEFYVLNLKPGGGNDSPTFADNVRVNYEGFTLKDVVFDSSVNPVSFDLISLIPGWRKVLPQFKTAESFVDNNDGTVSFINPGIGVMFLPSGLAYFSGAPTGVSAYSPLIFKFELLQTWKNDHDKDGIPSYLEDLDGDNEFTLEGDNTDGDNLPNYADADDDGDGVLTINELKRTTYVVDTNIGEQEPILNGEIEFVINRTEKNGVITIKTLKIIDSNENNINDYLEKDIKIKYN